MDIETPANQTTLEDFKENAELGDEGVGFVLYENENGERYWVWDRFEITRRDFLRKGLKLLYRGIVVSGIAGIVFKETGGRVGLKQVWPNAFYKKESEGVLSQNTIDTLLFNHRISWNNFKRESTSMLYNEQYVDDDRDVHLISVFFRDITSEFYADLMKASERNKSINIWIAAPHLGKHSPLEIHEDVEVVCFRELIRNTVWGEVYGQLAENNPDNRVPHPDDRLLNRIRALAESLRVLQALTFLKHRRNNVNVGFINDDEISLRGRVMSNTRASFVLNPKGTIGTAGPKIGYITSNSDIISALDDERVNIVDDGNFYSIEELEHVSETVYNKLIPYIDDARTAGKLDNDESEKLVENVDELFMSDSASLDIPIRNWVGENGRRKLLKRKLHNVRGIVNDACPFEVPADRTWNNISPDQMYSKAGRVVRSNPDPLSDVGL